MLIDKLRLKCKYLGLTNQFITVDHGNGMKEVYFVDNSYQLERMSRSPLVQLENLDELTVIEEPELGDSVMVAGEDVYTFITDYSPAIGRLSDNIEVPTGLWVKVVTDVSNLATNDAVASAVAAVSGATTNSSILSSVMDENNPDLNVLLESGEWAAIETEDGNAIQCNTNDLSAGIAAGSKTRQHINGMGYNIEYEFKFAPNTPSDAVFNLGMAFYDEENFLIDDMATSLFEKSIFKLAADYNPGDTTITLVDASDVINNGGNNSKITFHTSKDGDNTSWVSEEGVSYSNYSRDILEFDSVDQTSGVITLVAGSTIERAYPAGTYLRQGERYVGLPNAFKDSADPRLTMRNNSFDVTEWTKVKSGPIDSIIGMYKTLIPSCGKTYKLFFKTNNCDGLMIRALKVTPATKTSNENMNLDLLGSLSPSSMPYLDGEEHIVRIRVGEGVHTTTSALLEIDRTKVYNFNYKVRYRLPDGWKFSITTSINAYDENGYHLRSRENNKKLETPLVLTNELKYGDTQVSVDSTENIVPTDRDLQSLMYLYSQEDFSKGLGLTYDVLALIDSNSIVDQNTLAFSKPYTGRKFNAGDYLIQGAPNAGYHRYLSASGYIYGNDDVHKRYFTTGDFTGEEDAYTDGICDRNVKHRNAIPIGYHNKAKYMAPGMFFKVYDANGSGATLPDGYYIDIHSCKIDEKPLSDAIEHINTQRGIDYFNRGSHGLDKHEFLPADTDGAKAFRDSSLSNKIGYKVVKKDSWVTATPYFAVDEESFYRITFKARTHGRTTDRLAIYPRGTDLNGGLLQWDGGRGMISAGVATVLEAFDVSSFGMHVPVITDAPLNTPYQCLFPIQADGECKYPLNNGVYGEVLGNTSIRPNVETPSVDNGDGTWTTLLRYFRHKHRIQPGSKFLSHGGANDVRETILIDNRTNTGFNQYASKWYRGTSIPNSGIFSDPTKFLPNGSKFFRINFKLNMTDVDGNVRDADDDRTEIIDIKIDRIAPSDGRYPLVASQAEAIPGGLYNNGGTPTIK